MAWLDTVRFDTNGLVPVVAQEATSGELLMLAYANREALQKTAESGTAHYWSRSRQSLWMKGATSGNLQKLVEIRIDCDGDAVLYRVKQTGPACHTGRSTCFFSAVEGDEVVEVEAAGTILARVEAVVEDRRRNPVEGAYTNYLFEQGVDKILKKVGEEATEVVIAAKNDDPDELSTEIADLFFHLVVLLQARGVPLTRVWEVMDERFGRPPRERATSRMEDRR